MQIVNTKHHLLPQEFGFDFSHLSIGFAFQIAMEGATIYILHDKEDLFVRLKSFIKLCQALVIDLLHNFDLTFDTLATVGLQELKLLIYLDSNLLV